MFISYAQNFEDVMLWRVLKNVEDGFYVDIGAAWPELDSVTNAFYERGWKGINVEPNPELYKLLNRDRERDINLALAAGSHDGVVSMHIFDNPGLSTTVDSLAAHHLKTGYRKSKVEVPMVTLSQIWEQHVPQNQPVHFLKIDVEGRQDDTIRGGNWVKNRPWIVVVESTQPMSTIETHELWEHVLLGSGYVFAYGDGLNRFYVASERSELVPGFRYPPNIFDNFLQKKHYDTQVNLGKAIDLLNKIQKKLTHKEKELQNIYHSMSWEVTKPLRRVWEIGQQVILKIKSGLEALRVVVLSTASNVIIKFLCYSQSHLRLLSFTLGSFNNSTWIKDRVASIVSSTSTGRSALTIVIEENKEQLSPTGRNVYSDLKDRIEKKCGEDT